VIVGDVHPAEVLRILQDHYGSFAPSVVPPEDVKPEPPQTEERRAHTRKPTPTQKVAIGYRGPALGDFDHPPFVILNEILFGGRSSRVHRALVQKQEIATEVRGWVGTFRDPGLYDIYLSARGDHTVQDLVGALDEILAAVRATAVTPEELDKVKARVELSVLQGLETAAGKAEQIGFYETVLGQPAGLFDRLHAYRRVTPSDLLRVARRYLTSSARTIIEVYPDGSSDGEEAGDQDGQEEAQP
jgi:zinc protease